MKEEELMNKHSSHKAIYRSGNKHKWTTNHKHQSDIEVRQSRLCLRPFVSVGESFLFIFEALNVHHKSSNGLQIWSRCVLLDLKNPQKLTTLKTYEQSYQKWLAKVHSSIASLHKNGFASTIHQHFPDMNLLPWLQEPMVYIGLKWVTNFQLPPKIWSKKGPNIFQKWIKSLNSPEKINKKYYIIV